MAKDDVFDSFEDAIRGRTDIGNPWQMTPTGRHYELLQTLLAIPIEAGSGSESGRLANAIDAWVATELRRAGFPADEVWSRLTKPRVLPREVGLFVQGLPRKLRSDVEAQLARNATPPDVQADQFLAAMIEAVLARTPVEAHVEVRERHEHRRLPVTELDEEDDDLDAS